MFLLAIQILYYGTKKIGIIIYIVLLLYNIDIWRLKCFLFFYFYKNNIKSLYHEN